MNLAEIDSHDRIRHQEWLILQVSLHIAELMKKKNVNKTELARRLAVTKEYVTLLLDGTNITLKQIADVMLVLDSSLIVGTAPLGYKTTIETLLEEKTNEE